jgi:NTP pyrophosphatase (non-canonical NTP hydrolase)
MDSRQCHNAEPHEGHEWTMYYPSQTPEDEGLARHVECYGVKPKPLAQDDPKMYSWLLMSSTLVGEQLRSERIRAHEKHRDHSMESWPVLSPERYLVLAEEVGEVAKEFNDAKVEGRPIDADALRKELVQVAAMAVAWVAALDGGSPIHADGAS